MGDFLHQFLERDSLNDETLSILESNLILLSPHLESLNFAELIENIYWAGENIGQAKTLKVIKKMRKISLKIALKKIF